MRAQWIGYENEMKFSVAVSGYGGGSNKRKAEWNLAGESNKWKCLLHKQGKREMMDHGCRICRAEMVLALSVDMWIAVLLIK